MSVSPDQYVPPLTEIYLYLTGSCNLRCRHCWIDPAFERTTATDVLPWSAHRAILAEARDVGLQAVKLTGGEPMLHPDFVQALDDIAAMGLRIRLETNGTLIHAAEAAAIRRSNAGVSISLDGPTAEFHEHLRGVRGSFADTLAGIAALRAEGVGFEIIFSLYRHNEPHLEAMVPFARSLGARSLKINVVNEIARSKKMNERGELLAVGEVLEARRRMLAAHPATGQPTIVFDVPPAFKSLTEIGQLGTGTCGILGILGVLHNGHAGLCGIGEHFPDMDFGDLTKVSIGEVWRSHPVLRRIRAELPWRLGGVCGRCVWRNYCLGKCIANTFANTGQLLGGFDFCEAAHAAGVFPATRLVEHRPPASAA